MKKTKRKSRLKISSNNWGLIINGSSVLVSIGALVIAVVLFKETQVQTKNADKANRFTELALSRQKQKDYLADLNDSKKFILDSTSVAAQINALNSTQKRFEADHLTVIEAYDLALLFPNAAKNPYINIRIVSIGGISKIESTKFSYSMMPLQDSLMAKRMALEKLKKPLIEKQTVYVSDSKFTLKKLKMDVPLGLFKATLNQSFVIYVCGEINYVSLVNNTQMVMEFMMHTSSVDEVEYITDYLINKEQSKN